MSIISAPTTASLFSFVPIVAATPTAAATTTAVSRPMSPGLSKTFLIGTVIGCVGILLLLSVLALLLVDRRRKQRKEQKTGAEPVSYKGLDEAFTGVPFRESQINGQRSPITLVPSNYSTAYPTSSFGPPTPGLITRETDRFFPNTRDGDRDNTSITDQYFASPLVSSFPSPAQSSVRSHDRSLILKHTYTQKVADARRCSHSRGWSNGSQLTLHDPSDAHVLSAYGPLSPEYQASHLSPRRETQRDTMGFPIEPPPPAALVPDPDELRLHSLTPVLESPRSRRSLARPDSVELALREGVHSASSTHSDYEFGRVPMRAESPAESPVLGLKGVHVLIQNPAAQSLAPPGAELERTNTQKSVSTMGPVIGDEELYQLGVGARPPPLQVSSRPTNAI